MAEAVPIQSCLTMRTTPEIPVVMKTLQGGSLACDVFKIEMIQAVFGGNAQGAIWPDETK